ncbi:MAG: ABC transporter ATP-binding protein [Acidobacteriota bacterium]
MEIPVHIQDVWKTFGSTSAVRGLRLNVPPQSVYGFLGPNGAGKSTTIRMVLDLQRPSRGTISLFGRPLAAERTSLLQRIGSMVEAPALYSHLTGRENLEVHRRVLRLPKWVIGKALETVDLSAVGGRLVRNYSSGMKQRLGLAQALLGDPELLILDEPTNGLDPAGIHEVRELVRDLPRRCGMTVFLSSHLLAEVEQVATHFAIISQGRRRFEGTPQELRQQSRETIVIDVDPADKAAELLAGLGLKILREGSRLRIDPDVRFPAAALNAMLIQAGVQVSQLITQRATLEDAFLRLTAEGSETIQ